MTHTVPVTIDRTTRSRLPVLVTSQILGGVGVATGIAVGALLAEQVSGSASLSGLAQSASVLGSALLAVPLATIAERRGRAPALSTGYLIALVGAAGVLGAAVLDAFWLLLLGMVLLGAASTTGLQARYAAIDTVDEAHRGRVLSTVVWATTIGAVLGPNLSGLGGRVGVSMGVPSLSGPFLFSVAAFGVAAVVLLALPGGRISLGHSGSAVSTQQALSAVRACPSALAGLTAMAGGHAVMVSVMVMTPVHLGHGGATLQIVGLVISLHIAGMYALSPLIGLLTDQWGAAPTIGLGSAVLLASLLVTATASGSEHAQVGVGLTLLGLGWSACMVAGSALLSGSVPEPVRTKVQGTGDLVMGLSAAAAGVVAGPVLDAGGYDALSLAAMVLLVPIVVLVLRARPRTATGLPGQAA